MFNFLKTVLGGKRAGNTPLVQTDISRADDAAAAQRKRDEEERKRQQEAARAARQQQLDQLRAQAAVPAANTLQKAPQQKQQELDSLTQQNLPQARQQQKQGRNFFDVISDKLAGNADEQRAQTQARNKAAQQYQDKYGYDNDANVKLFNQTTLNKAQDDSQRAQTSIQKTKRNVDIARYVPGAGIGELAANAARGNFSGSKEADDRVLREQLDLKQNEVNSLSPEDRNKYLNVSKAGLGAGLLDFVGLGAGSLVKAGAKNGAKQAAEQTAKTTIKQELKKVATKKGAAELTKRLTVNATVGAGAGATIGYGAAKYLGADDEAAAQAGTRAAITGAAGSVFTSPLDSVTETLRKNGTAVKNGLQKVSPVKNEEKAAIPNMKAVTPEESASKVEIAPGIKIDAPSPNEINRAPAPAPAQRVQAVPEPEVQASVAPEAFNPQRPEQVQQELQRLPSEESQIANEAQLRAQFQRDVTARPDLRVQLQQKLDSDLQQASQLASQTKSLQDEAAALENVPKPAQSNIPDPAAPIALAKSTPEDVPIADFSRAITPGDLQKADPIVPEPAPVIANLPPETVQGDALPTDLNAAEALPAPSAEEAPVLPAEAQQLAGDVNMDTPAPNTRAAAVSQLSDPEVRDDLMQNAPRRETVSLDDAETNARIQLNNLDDSQVLASFSNGVNVSDPSSFYLALNAVRRLETIDSPEAQVGIRNAIDAMANYASESGRGLRTVQVLFDEMPASLKVDYLMKRLSNAGADLNDADRAQLAGFIQKADDATTSLRTLQDKANALLDSGQVANGNVTPELQAQARNLAESIQEAQINKESASGAAFRDYQRHIDGSLPLGKKAGDLGRTLMLSAPSGRVFDLASTGITSADDLLNRGVSNLIGKGVNLIKGAGSVTSALPNVGQLAKGFGEGINRTYRALKGDDFVEDFLGEAKRSTRGDINQGGGIVRRTIRAAVELPTNLTRGLREDELYRQGIQEANTQGLKGDAADLYAKVRSLVPKQDQLDSAQQVQLRANMLHENGVSRALNSLSRSLDSNKALGGWLAPIIRNQVAPFTSWLGGNLHRTFTDKNVVYNAYKIVDGAVKGDAQTVVDNVARLAVNGAQAYAIGTVLTNAGIITNTDANGDDYGGAYFHIGDRYIPVAIAGTAAIPIILGNAYAQAQDAQEQGEDGSSAFLNALTTNTLKNAGVASVFGGENNLQSSVLALTKGQADVKDTAAGFGGDLLRQYVPSLTGDVNAVLNNSPLNPTGEAADTKALTGDPNDNANKQDALQTEINKTVNRIPFASQTLDRKEGEASADWLDRILKSNRETGDQAGTREKTQTLAQTKKALEKEGIPTTADDIAAFAESGDYDKAIAGSQYLLKELDSKENVPQSRKDKISKNITKYQMQQDGVPVDNEEIKAATESGDYKSAMKGLQYQLSQVENDDKVPDSKKQSIRDDITTLEVTRNGRYSPDVMALYAATSVSEWRALGNPESEDYDPDTYAELLKYDRDLSLAGVSGSTKGGDKAKFTPKKSGGRGGSGGSSKKTVDTDIATNSISFSPKALTKQDASFATPQSAVPVIQKVQNYDTSKLKKITVK